MNNLYEIQHLQMFYPMKKGFRKKITGYVRAVNDISFFIREGETLGVVGESGCGKSTLGNCIIRLLEPTGGSICYAAADGKTVALEALSDRDLRFYRREAQMIFQDPYSSLNPRMTVRDLVGEPLIVNYLSSSADEINDRVGAILRRVGLRAEYMKRYPHAFSGGQRQRISIARALIMRPRFIICDEAVSALDVSVQAQIIELLQNLQDEYKLTYLFISHDLSVVKHISDRVLVMYLGRIVELCDSDELFDNTLHPYTRALISAIPTIDGKRNKIVVSVSGEVGDPSKEYPGCAFVSRCKFATEACGKIRPALVNVAPDGEPEHLVACHAVRDGALQSPVSQVSTKE